MNVGELKAALESVPDDCDVQVETTYLGENCYAAFVTHDVFDNGVERLTIGGQRCLLQMLQAGEPMPDEPGQLPRLDLTEANAGESSWCDTTLLHRDDAAEEAVYTADLIHEAMMAYRDRVGRILTDEEREMVAKPFIDAEDAWTNEFWDAIEEKTS